MQLILLIMVIVYLQLQQPRHEIYSKECDANLGRRRIISMVQKNFHLVIRPYLIILYVMYSSYVLWLQKANNEKSTKIDEGYTVSCFPHKQPTSMVCTSNLSKFLKLKQRYAFGHVIAWPKFLGSKFSYVKALYYLEFLCLTFL
jgi:hypothetical protein